MEGYHSGTYVREIEQIERDKVLTQRMAELEKQRELLEQERITMRMSFYRPLIEGGHWNQLTLHLAKNPDDVEHVIDRLNQHQMLELEKTLRILKFMEETDAIEGFHLQGVGQGAIQRLVELTGMDVKVLTGSSSPVAMTDERQQSAGQLTAVPPETPDDPNDL